ASSPAAEASPSTSSAQAEAVSDAASYVSSHASPAEEESQERAQAAAEPERPAERPEGAPLYQPAPAPFEATPVPLPPQQEVRVPGAALAAVLSGEAQMSADDAVGGSASSGFDPAPQRDWSTPSAEIDAGRASLGQAVPHPRDAAESPVSSSGLSDAPGHDQSVPSGPVSASAAVPAANRIAPPADPAALAGMIPAPQPRVYGRPTTPTAEEQTPGSVGASSASAAPAGVGGSGFYGGSAHKPQGSGASPVSPSPFFGDSGQRPTGTARVPTAAPSSGLFDPPGAAASEPPAATQFDPVVPAPALPSFDPAVHAPRSTPEPTGRFEAPS